MYFTMLAIGRYTRHAVTAREAENLARGIVDFIRENGEKSASEFTTSTISLLQHYRSYTTGSGKNFHWVGDR